MTEEQHVDVEGGALRVRILGRRDGPTMLVLHGGPGMSDHYLDGLLAELEDGYRLAVHAQRGVSPSTAGAPYDMASQAGDAVAVLDALGWDDAIVLGHSFGGHLLLHLVAAHPERVRAAVAVEPLGAVGDGGAAEFSAELMRRLTAADRVRLERPGLTDEEQLEILWPAYFPPGSAAPPFSPVELSSEANEQGWGAIVEALAELPDRLRDAAVPVRILVADGSPMPAAAAAETAAAIGARASVARIPGGHFPWLQRPGVVREAVDAFLSDGARPVRER